MTYFAANALTQGQSNSYNLDSVWSVASFDYSWSNGADVTRQATIYGSVDEGQNWFQILSITSSDLAVSTVTNTSYCVNAVKVQNTTATTGNTLTVRFTGK